VILNVDANWKAVRKNLSKQWRRVSNKRIR
jgi:hypothetical protein